MFKESLENLLDYITGLSFWEAIMYSAVKIMIILVLSFICIRIGNKLIDRIFRQKYNKHVKINEKREQTIKILLKSVLTYTVYFITIIMILEALSIKITGLLAGAGIAGLAIGFGAQSLVKDVISGFFIIFEKQFSIDDYVSIAGIEGTVVEIGLRTTKVMSWTGEEHVIPNGNITQVVNYSIYNGTSVVDMYVPYEVDINIVEEKVNNIIEGMHIENSIFISRPTIQGIRTLDISNYMIRIIAETEPSSQWQGERIIRKEIQHNLYKAGINVPLQQFIVHSTSIQKDF